ncbi:MAG: acyltransferase family protein, partial [Cyanobacteria bacterium P01_H01_bin.26]
MGSATTRLLFLDNLRTCLTMLVVAHHAAQPYGPTGGAWPIFNPERAAILGPFFAVNAAFFMGLFFFISGYFLPAAHDRKGWQQFLCSRFQRLGLPLLFFSLVVFPVVLYRLAAPSISFFAFIDQVYIQSLEIEVAHLWFVVHLLFYAVCYVLWRRCRGCFDGMAGFSGSGLLGHRAVLIYLFGLTVVTFIVRIDYPIDRWVTLLGFLPTEIAHLPQYASLFVLGIVAYRCHWLRKITSHQGFAWLRIGLGAALLRYGYSLSRDRLRLPDVIAGGGWDWRSLVWSGWEATICV